LPNVTHITWSRRFAATSLAWKIRKGLIREPAPLSAENKAELRRVLADFETMQISQAR
jgi:hypothetical protein